MPYTKEEIEEMKEFFKLKPFGRIKDGCIGLYFPGDEPADDYMIKRSFNDLKHVLDRYKIKQFCGVFVPGNEEAMEEILSSSEEIVFPGIYIPPMEYLNDDEDFNVNFKDLAGIFKFVYINDSLGMYVPDSVKETMEDAINAGFYRFQIPVTQNFVGEWADFIKGYTQRGIMFYFVHGAETLANTKGEEFDVMKQAVAGSRNILLGTSTSANGFFDGEDKKLKEFVELPELRRKIVYESNYNLVHKTNWYSAIYERAEYSIDKDHWDDITHNNIEAFLR